MKYQPHVMFKNYEITRDRQVYFVFINLFLSLCIKTMHSISDLTSQTVREVYCIITKSTFQFKSKILIHLTLCLNIYIKSVNLVHE